ncbi:MAG: ribonuclease J [Parcubacteria group bacterium Gr01-1014_44]|nr:MAG: ribonuclease J [Parcubacteria group bacterium Gr01-1014_44]
MIVETAKKPRKGSWGRNPRGPKRDTHRAPSGFSKAAKSDSTTPISHEDTLKIVPLGGLGEIGKNMCFLEYKDDIIVIDAGFKFPDEDFLGVDYIIPNTEYLEKNRERIRGVLFTHGHMDHIGGWPYLQEKLGNPDIYGAALTRGLILKRHEEFTHLPQVKFHLVKADDVVKLGDHFEVEFFHVNHNIPDDMALFIKTPAGNIVHTADFKFDHSPTNGKPIDLEHLRQLGDRGVTVLMSDSTGAEKEGHSISEKTIMENLDLIFQESQNMIVCGTFSSLIDRVQQIILLSEKYGRKVIFEGYSMKSNVEIAKELGYIKMQKGTQITKDQVNNYPRSQITVVATGAQGEANAALMRIANLEHRFIRLQKKDTVIFSSSAIPGNERSVQNLKDMFYRTGVKVYHYQMMDIHAGGHAQKEDLGHMIELMRPKFLMPIHGQYSMMVSHSELGQTKGLTEDDVIIADNGSIIHLANPEPNNPVSPQAKWWFDKKTLPTNPILVDGLGIGDVGNVVLRDRQVLAEDGFVVVIVVIDTKTGRVINSPDVISRGFIYLKDNKELVAQVRKKARFIVEKGTTGQINTTYIKDNLRDEIGKFLFQKTEKRPMILPVTIEV